MTIQTLKSERFIWHNLLNCALRELSLPTEVKGHHLHIELVRSRQSLRVGLLCSDPLQFSDEINLHLQEGWHPVSWSEVGELLSRELTLQTGEENPEFLGQLEESARFTLRFLQDPTPAPADPYLHSEQALVLGHRYHPTPKSRSGSLKSWEKYSPELKQQFALRYFAVREDHFETNREDLTRFEHEGVVPPAGYRLLPAHPWQARLALAQPAIRQAVEKGILLDLGEGTVPYHPTSSIRTLHRPGHPWHYKFSLHARITNCLRKNAHYELTGATVITEHLAGVLPDLTRHYPEVGLLREPAYCTVKLDSSSKEYLGMLLRENPLEHPRPPGEVVLAGALVDEGARHPLNLQHLSSGHLLDFWTGYLQHTVQPVLYLLFQHGVVLEPHLQNVLVVLQNGLPVGALFRDLEGTKILPEHHSSVVLNATPEVRNALTYTRERGYRRVAYCLLVNHLLEMARAVLLRRPDLKKAVWDALRHELHRYQERWGTEPEVQHLLQGAAWPAKTNLLSRWQRQADREAGYVPLESPLKEQL